MASITKPSSKDIASTAKVSSAKTLNDVNLLLKQHLLASGWPSKLVKDVIIVEEKGEYSVKYLSDEAYAKEFGTETIRPSGNVRKFFAKKALIESVAAKNFTKSLEKFV